MTTGEGYMKAAYAYLYIRDFARASEAFKRAIESDPTNPTYYFRASVTAHRNGLHELALEFAKQAVEIAPSNALYQSHLDIVEAAILVLEGQAAILEGNMSQAVASFESALERDPLNTDARVALERTKGWMDVSDENHLPNCF